MRDIKPGFYLNEELAECSCWARLIFPGLWMLADREGRLEYRPKRIKAELLPYDGEDMAALIGELEAHGLVKKYEVEGKKYLWIPSFSRHQKPHPNEKQSEIPPCPEEQSLDEHQNISKDESTLCQDDADIPPRYEVGITKVKSASHQGDTQSGLLSLSSSSLVKNTHPLPLASEGEDDAHSSLRSGSREEGTNPRAQGTNPRKSRASPAYSADFEAFWQAYPRKIGKDAAYKVWKRKRHELPPPEELAAILARQCHCEQWQRDGGQYIPHPATWLNQGRWQDEIEGQTGTVMDYPEGW